MVDCCGNDRKDCKCKSKLWLWRLLKTNMCKLPIWMWYSSEVNTTRATQVGREEVKNQERPSIRTIAEMMETRLELVCLFVGLVDCRLVSILAAEWGVVFIKKDTRKPLPIPAVQLRPHDKPKVQNSKLSKQKSWGVLKIGLRHAECKHLRKLKIHFNEHTPKHADGVFNCICIPCTSILQAKIDS